MAQLLGDYYCRDCCRSSFAIDASKTVWALLLMYAGPVASFSIIFCSRDIKAPTDSPYIYIRIQSVIKYFSRDGSFQMRVIYASV